jgi:hypothetical protein
MLIYLYKFNFVPNMEADISFFYFDKNELYFYIFLASLSFEASFKASKINLNVNYFRFKRVFIGILLFYNQFRSFVFIFIKVFSFS